MRYASHVLWTVGSTLAVAAAVTFGSLTTPAAARTLAAAPAVPVGGRIQADNACYVRLPDLPAGRSAGFGAYNATTGVLAYAGGSVKMNANLSQTMHDLFAIDLTDPGPAWRTIPYGAGGYSRAKNKGCSAGASVAIDPAHWLSVFGKGGCDNGAIDTRSAAGGDIKGLQLGDTATGGGVRWIPNTGAMSLPNELQNYKGKLTNLFATYDARRERVVFGQGTFNGKMVETTNDEVYAASHSGPQWQISQLRPTGDVPARRHSSCGAYVADAATGLDGIVVVGGQEPAPKGAASTTYKEVWWLDFAASPRGEWHNVTARFGNMDAYGGRSGMACAYDADRRMFYSWMGKTTPIPDGGKQSSGVWRFDVAMLAEPNAPLAWERVAKDNTAPIPSRAGIPSLWDPVKRRILVVGGAAGSGAFKDVWAIYPDIVGAECDTLDPYGEPGSPGVVPTATALPPVEPTPER